MHSFSSMYDVFISFLCWKTVWSLLGLYVAIGCTGLLIMKYKVFNTVSIISVIWIHEGFDRDIKLWTNFYPNFDFTVKSLVNSNSWHRHYFKRKAYMNVTVRFHTKPSMQNKILASKIQNREQRSLPLWRPFYLEKWRFQICDVNFFLVHPVSCYSVIFLQVLYFSKI